MNSTKRNLTSLALLSACALGGCAGLPAAGPTAEAIKDSSQIGSKTSSVPYVLVDLDIDKARVVAAASSPAPSAQGGSLPSARAVGAIGPGDVIKVSMWQADQTAQTSFDKGTVDTTVRVEADGTAAIPFAGRFRAAGRTAAQIERELAGTLAHQAIGGVQVAVFVLDDVTNGAIVQGDVARPGRYPLTESGRRVLDLVAAAGGTKDLQHDDTVRVARGGAAMTFPLSGALPGGRFDIELSPGDRVSLHPAEKWFYAFGAVQRPGEQPWAPDGMTMARALARLAGLDDNKANPHGVFIYRHQDPALTLRLAGPTPGRDEGEVIYRIDLRDPAGYIVAANFPTLPGDIVYVSNAPLADTQKVLQIIAGISSIGAVPRNLGAPY